MPRNAYLNDSSFGSGWECMRGFTAVSLPCGDDPGTAGDGTQRRPVCKDSPDRQACAPVALPPNSYLDAAGQGWRCERGFKRVSATCVALVVPANAHVDYSGADWDCDPPYLKRQDGCALPY